MQLVCQRNSLNRRDVTAKEIAEPSEILTVQENKGDVVGGDNRGKLLFARENAAQATGEEMRNVEVLF
jgi:hypothetical protein